MPPRPEPIALQDRRRQPRFAVGQVHIQWTDSDGFEQHSTAKVMNVSLAGAQLSTTAMLPTGTNISYEDPGRDYCGSGSIVYCSYDPAEGRYTIGLTFEKRNAIRSDSPSR